MAIRKIYDIVEETRLEGGRPVDPAARVAASLAVVDNLLAGRWAEDLSLLIETYSEELGSLLGGRCRALLAAPAEAVGKGALVGTDGEVEHGSAIIHTLRFGDPVRRAADGATSFLPSAEKRGGSGATLDIALKHLHDLTTRSHHQTFEVRIPDAPAPGEILVAVAMASRGRPQSRLAPFGTAPGERKEEG